MENNYLKYKKYKLKYLKLKDKMEGGLLVEKPKCFNSNSVYNTNECNEPNYPCVTSNLRCASVNNVSNESSGVRGVIKSLNVEPLVKKDINIQEIRNQIFSQDEKELYRLKIYPSRGINYDFDERFKLGDFIRCGSFACVYKIKNLEDVDLQPLIRLADLKTDEIKGLENQYKLRNGDFINKLYSFGVYYLEKFNNVTKEYNTSDQLVSPLNCLNNSQELPNCRTRNVKGIFGLIEECKGGELFDKIRIKQGMSLEQSLDEYDYKDENSVRELITNLLTGVNYMHANNIIHNDLKPENIAIVDDLSPTNIRILDFGFSVDLSKPDQRPISGKGTPGYVAPEHYLKNTYVTNKVDIYSCGAILLTVLTRQSANLISENQRQVIDKKIIIQTDSEGRQSFFIGKSQILYTWIAREIVKFINNPKDKRNVINFLYTLLENNPQRRVTSAQALNHPWIINV